MKEWLKANSGKVIWALIFSLVALPAYFIKNCYENRVPDIKIIQNVRTVEEASYTGLLSLDLGNSEIASASGLAMTTYFLDISNTGRGSEEELSIHVRFPKGVIFEYKSSLENTAFEPSDPIEQSGEVFLKFNNIPKNARMSLAFEIREGFDLICGAKVKAVGKESEWPVTANWGQVCGS